jgi:hypothetical protein
MGWIPFALCWMAVAVEPGPANAAAPLGTAEFLVDAIGTSTQTFLLPRGPATVEALELLPTADTADAWFDVRLRLTWDSDDPHPTLAGFDLPVRLAVGSGPSDRPWVVRGPMPFHRLALLRLDADRPIRGRIRLRVRSGAEGGYLRAAATGRGFAGDAVTGTGRGRVVGVFVASDARLEIDGRSETLRPSKTADPPAWRLFHDEPRAFATSFRLVADAQHGTAAAIWYSDRPAAAAGERASRLSRGTEEPTP